MFSLDRRIAGVGSAIAVAVVAVGCGMSHAAVKSNAKAVSPCGTVNAPAWSPDGTQVAWFGYRWPRPANGHATGAYNILRAFCTSNADGTNLHPIPKTTCGEKCPNNLGDPPGQLNWVSANLLVYGSDDGVHTITVGHTPRALARTGPVQYSLDAQGDRLATNDYAEGCVSCRGPVRVFSVPSGAVVGTAGGTKLFNYAPSLSPDGSQVVFVRQAPTDSGQPAIWTASADGSHLKRLEQHGTNPVWSPAGALIAYSAPTGPGTTALRLVAPQGGKSRVLLRSGPGELFGWSPDGKYIAFPAGRNLAVVNVATGKVRTLLKPRHPFSSSSAAWSPDSQQLLVLVERPPTKSKCPSGLWRVPLAGGKPHLVHTC